MAGPEEVSIGRAARELGLSVPQLRRLADASRVPFEVTGGGHRRFDVSAVRSALIAAGRLPSDSDILGAPTWQTTEALEGLMESDVWLVATRALGLPEGSEKYAVFHYAFTEMLNNAIDHSRGTVAFCRSWDSPLSFEIRDDGVGAFARLRDDLGLPSIADAVAELTKGKGTSDPTRHSGQGIFFTSKVLDEFRLEANGLLWIVDNVGGEQALGTSRVREGTRVFGRVPEISRRTIAEVFGEYTDDELEFSRTRPLVRLSHGGGAYVSRSEAKLLLSRLEQFREVELDFAGVDTVGQGFADEVFRVWPLVHPNTSVTPVNMNPAVQFMVDRARAQRS